MKKLSLIIVAVAIVSLVACKKDRVCECKTDGSTTTDKTTYLKVNKRQAKANCVSYTVDLGGGLSQKVTCELKK